VTDLVLAGLGFAAIAAFWWWREGRRAHADDPSPKELQAVQESLRLSKSDPEAAKRVLEPYVRAYEAQRSALRAGAETDAGVAREFQRFVEKELIGAEAQLEDAGRRDPVLEAQLQQEVAKLRNELTWAQEREGAHGARKSLPN